MKITAKQISFWISVVLVLVVVPYSLIEWFDKSIPFSDNLYILCGCAIALFLINLLFLKRMK